MSTTQEESRIGEKQPNLFKIESYANQQPVMYFVNYGPTSIIEGEYKIVTYLFLADYVKKYEYLGKK